MTYATLKAITTGMLTGDNLLPIDPEILQGLVQYALTTVAMQAESLHLMTLSTTENVLRLSQGDYLIRMPVAPPLDPDPAVVAASPIDIDEELTFAVARYLASYISREKGGIHVIAADRIIKDYNMKTYEVLEQMALEAYEAGVANTDASLPNTEWVV